MGRAGRDHGDGGLVMGYVAVEGQSFFSEQDWINRETRCLTSHPKYRNTEHGDVKGWRGEHFTALF